QSYNVTGLKPLDICRDHSFRQTLDILSDKITSGFHNAITTSIVFLKPNLLNVWVPCGETGNVFEITATPLIDRLIVIPDHTQMGAEIVQQLNDAFLNRINVLILIDDDVLDPTS